jgi:hypothetical protein
VRGIEIVEEEMKNLRERGDSGRRMKSIGAWGEQRGDWFY